MASLLLARFGLFAVAARLSSSGFEPGQDQAPAAGWSPFRRLDPRPSDWQQPAIVSMRRHTRGVGLPPIMSFRSF
jgi:hypothetical protein